MIAVVGLFAYTLVAIKMMTKPILIALFLTNPFLLEGLRNGNIDWMVPLGFLLPPQWGLFLVLAKPQIGLAVAVFWFIEAARSGGVRQVVTTFAPVTLALFASVVIYGPWPLGGLGLPGVSWDFSLWPYSIPIGMALLIDAIQKRNIRPAVTAGPFLAPYVSIPGWSVALLGLDGLPFIAATLGMWIVKLI